MFSLNKNSYLQLMNGPPPRIINRCVAKAWKGLTDYGHSQTDLNPEVNRLTSEQPCMPIKYADVTRRPLAFGNLRVLELRRELHSGDADLMLAAINTFCDILHDPEIAYEAIKLNVPDRLANLIVHKRSAVRERVCIALTILSGAGDASMAIVHNPLIMRGLKVVIDDVEGDIRRKAALLIDRLCLLWMAADVLIKNGFIELLVDCVIKDAAEIAAIHFRSLESMFYSDSGRKVAFQLNFFPILVEYIKDAPSVVLPGALRCIGNILVLREVKQLAIKLNLIDILANFIQHKEPAVYNATAFVLMMATLKMRAKLQAFKYDAMQGRLVELCYNWQNEETQTYCIKALTNLCEYPPMRLNIHKRYLKEVEAIQVKNLEVKKYKEILVDLMMAVTNLEQKIFMEDAQMKAADHLRQGINIARNVLDNMADD